MRHARGWGTLCSRHAGRFRGSAEALHYHPVNHRPQEAKGGGGGRGSGGATGPWRDMQTGHLIPLPSADYRCPPCWQPHSQRSLASFRRPSTTLPIIIHRVLPCGPHARPQRTTNPACLRASQAVTPLGFSVYRPSPKVACTSLRLGRKLIVHAGVKT